MDKPQPKQPKRSDKPNDKRSRKQSGDELKDRIAELFTDTDISVVSPVSESSKGGDALERALTEEAASQGTPAPILSTATDQESAISASGAVSAATLPVSGSDSKPGDVLVSPKHTKRSGRSDASTPDQMAALLEKRVRELNCLNDIGHKIDERPPLSEFLPWVAARIPAAMLYPEECIVAIEHQERIYGHPEARDLPTKVVGGLRISGELVGWLHIAYTRPHSFVDAESALVGGIVSRISGYIESLQQQQESHRHAEELSTLNEMARALMLVFDFDTILENIYHYTARLMDISNFYIALYDAETDLVSFPIAYSENEPIQVEPNILGQGGLTDYVIRTAEPLLLSDNLTQGMQDLGIPLITFGNDIPPLSWLGVPILYGQRPLGVIAVQSITTPGLYTEHHRDILIGVARQAANAIAISRQYARTQAALELQQAILDGSNYLIISTTPEGLITTFNRGAERLLGYTAQELVGKQTLATFHDPQEIIARAQTFSAELGIPIEPGFEVFVAKTRHNLPNEHEWTYVRKDGTRFPAMLTVSAMHDSAGAITGFVGLASDITERKQTETERQQALIEAELLYTGSSRIANATTIPNALHALVTSTMLQRMDRVNILAFDHPWEQQLPETLTVLAVWERERSDGQPRSAAAPPGTVYPFALFPALQSLQPDQPLTIADVPNDPRLDPNLVAAFLRLGMHSAVIYPLRVSGQWYGILTAQSAVPQTWSETEIRRITNLIDQIATLTHGLRLLEQTRQSEQTVRSIIESTPDWIFIRDRENRYRLANKSFADLLHRPPQDLIGKTEQDLGLSSDYGQADRQILETGQPHTYPNQTVIVDGQPRVFSIYRTPLFDERNQPWAVLTFGRDVTERSQFEELQTRQARELAKVAEIAAAVASTLDPTELLQRVADLTKTGFAFYHTHIYLLDPTGQTLELAAGAGEVGRQMVAQGWRIPFDSPRSLVARTARQQHGLVVDDVTLELDWLPNPLLPETFSEMAVPILAADRLLGVLDIQSETVSCFTETDIAIQTTLASQVAVALQNARQYQQTRASERLVRSLIDATPDWIFIKDRQHRFRLVNQGYASALHLSPEALLGKNDLELGFKEEAVKGDLQTGRRGYWEDDDQVIQTGESLVIPAEPTLQDGQTHYMHTLKVPLRDDEGAVWGVLGFVRDVTEREQLLHETDALYKANTALNRAASYQDILDVLRIFTLFGNGAQNVSLNWFDRPWTPDQKPEWIHTLARWSQLPAGAVSDRYPIRSFPSIDTLLHPNAPTLIEDVLTDPAMDENARALYAQRFGAKSTVFVPLVVAGQWIGYTNAIYQQPTTFPEPDVRRLTALVDQAAASVQRFKYLEEVLRLLQQAQQHAQREQALREISTHIRASMDPDVILRTTVRELGSLLGRKTFVRIHSAENPSSETAPPDLPLESTSPISDSDSEAIVDKGDN